MLEKLPKLAALLLCSLLLMAFHVFFFFGILPYYFQTMLVYIIYIMYVFRSSKSFQNPTYLYCV